VTILGGSGKTTGMAYSGHKSSIVNVVMATWNIPVVTATLRGQGPMTSWADNITSAAAKMLRKCSRTPENADRCLVPCTDILAPLESRHLGPGYRHLRPLGAQSGPCTDIRGRPKARFFSVHTWQEWLIACSGSSAVVSDILSGVSDTTRVQSSQEHSVGATRSGVRPTGTEEWLFSTSSLLLACLASVLCRRHRVSYNALTTHHCNPY
jgi:hypothetical protein